MQILLVISGVALRNEKVSVPDALWVLQLFKMILIKIHHFLVVNRIPKHLPMYFTLHIGPHRVDTSTVGRNHSFALARSRVAINPTLMQVLLVDGAL